MVVENCDGLTPVLRHSPTLMCTCISIRSTNNGGGGGKYDDNDVNHNDDDDDGDDDNNFKKW